LQHSGYVVDGQLHLFVVADIGLGNQVFDLARANPRQGAQLSHIPSELPGPSRFAQKTIVCIRQGRGNFRTVQNGGPVRRMSTC
jgi:hypothetical protein